MFRDYRTSASEGLRVARGAGERGSKQRVLELSQMNCTRKVIKM